MMDEINGVLDIALKVPKVKGLDFLKYPSPLEIPSGSITGVPTSVTVIDLLLPITVSKAIIATVFVLMALLKSK